MLTLTGRKNENDSFGNNQINKENDTRPASSGSGFYMLKKTKILSCFIFAAVLACHCTKQPAAGGLCVFKPIPEWQDQTGFDQWIFQSAYSTCVRLTVPFALVDTTFYLPKNTS
jgi:hypothetical protein